MNEEERMRKTVILNLIYLRREWFRELFGLDVLTAFPVLFEMEQIGLLTIENDCLSLTEKGVKYRDLIVQCFLGKR
jgi:coproporphyrinogen III oxidase-like Fe-S oxidoreductase